MKKLIQQINNISIDNAILIIGSIIRIVYFIINTFFVGGLHDDEAMTALNSYSLADHGTDILGNSFPIYFCTWISGGQSPVATYICAIFVKIFGHSLFAVRFPSLILSIIGLFFFAKFTEELFGKRRYTSIANALVAVSPWFIFSGVYTLDCNYATYMIIIACYLFVKGYNTGKNRHYIISMLFFALGFYSYIASVILIPILLVVLYACLLAKKKISLQTAVISVISLMVFSAGFIAFGLVSVGILPEFSIANITFGGMEHYVRADSIVFTDDGGIWEVLVRTLTNIVLSVSFSLFIDISNTALGLNIFQFGNLFAGIFFTLGVIDFVIACIRKKRSLTCVQKSILMSFGFALFAFFSIVNFASLAYVYRYGVLSIFYIPFEALGILKLLNVARSKKGNIFAKKTFATYLIISLCIFNGVFFFSYVPYTRNAVDIIYSDSLFECLDYCKENNITHINTINSYEGEQRKESIFLRYYYGTNNMINYYDEYIQRIQGSHNIAVSDNINMYIVSDDFELTQDCYISTIEALGMIDTSNYEIKDYGNYFILTKNS